MLPWFVMANIGVTLVAIFLFRIFAFGQWAAQQQQQAATIARLISDLADEHRDRRKLAAEMHNTFSKVYVVLARMEQQLKNLERGGAGRD